MNNLNSSRKFHSLCITLTATFWRGIIKKVITRPKILRDVTLQTLERQHNVLGYTPGESKCNIKKHQPLSTL